MQSLLALSPRPLSFALSLGTEIMKANLDKWEKICGLLFGVIFITIILTLTIYFPDPTPKQYAVFRTILAIAAAGVGGILAGFIHVQGKILKVSVRAGGAFALFVIVYFFNPAMPKDQTLINQIMNGKNGTQIGVVEGVLNIKSSKK